ncbi:Late embryogenesis abundant protein [Macleaya cordata]|uniref:Late embryogenesis abundant protein n=1 Tax=Macleaya cordata TaxID=56857 RepID=A0A200PNZ7_MACCD|nr:Late embryogenesis abundant protein [Macleaya cordata]
MAAKGEPVTYYSPLPTVPDPNHLRPLHNPDQNQYYILVPLNPHRRRFRNLRRSLYCFFSLIILALIIFFLWPSDPDLKVVRLNLTHVQIHTSPTISLDISMALTIRVHNRDIYSLDYKSVVVSIGYRGRQLGLVSSNEGHLRARSSSYVNATLHLDGIEILHDVFYLLEDLARGSIPFDTVTEIQGKLGLFFFELPIKVFKMGKLS